MTQYSEATRAFQSFLKSSQICKGRRSMDFDVAAQRGLPPQLRARVDILRVSPPASIERVEFGYGSPVRWGCDALELGPVAW